MQMWFIVSETTSYLISSLRRLQGLSFILPYSTGGWFSPVACFLAHLEGLFCDTRKFLFLEASADSGYFTVGPEFHQFSDVPH